MDATAPTVTVRKTERLLFKGEETIALDLTITDRNSIQAGTYTFTVNGTAAITACAMEILGTTTSRTNTDCTVTVNTAAANGQEILLNIPELTDGAGNVKTAHTTTLGRVDTQAPTLSAITEQDDTRKKRFSFTIEAIHNQHTNNTEISETLTPVFSGDCAKFKAEPDWTAETPDSTTVTYTASFSAPKGTYRTCTLTLRDEAGNESAESLTFEEFSIRGGGGVGRLALSFFKTVGSFFAPSTEQQQQILAEQQPTTQTQGSYYFTENLSYGDTGEAVRQLQIFLNNSGYTIAATGAGSPGNETTYFGNLTKQALIRYQQAHNITPASGYFGPITRAQVNGENAPSAAGASSTPSVPDTGNPQTINIPIPASITATYSLGESHSDIKAAQILLNQTTCPVATTGAGSPGNETTYLGPLTQTALRCFQGQQGLTQDGILTPALYATIVTTVQAGGQSAPAPDGTPTHTPPQFSLTGNNDGDDGDDGDDGNNGNNNNNNNNDGGDGNDGNNDNNDNNNNDGGDDGDDGDDGYNPIGQPFLIQRPVNTGAPTF